MIHKLVLSRLVKTIDYAASKSTDFLHKHLSVRESPDEPRQGRQGPHRLRLPELVDVGVAFLNAFEGLMEIPEASA